jgi:hypothetical protein
MRLCPTPLAQPSCLRTVRSSNLVVVSKSDRGPAEPRSSFGREYKGGYATIRSAESFGDEGDQITYHMYCDTTNMMVGQIWGANQSHDPVVPCFFEGFAKKRSTGRLVLQPAETKTWDIRALRATEEEFYTRAGWPA